jgi:adenosylcobinamide-GDP ribazoletransferase
MVIFLKDGEAMEFGWRAWRDDVIGAVQFLTRLPGMPLGTAFEMRRAGRVLPLVGAGIGGVIGACYWLLHGLHVPALAAAALPLALGALLTGGLHEDGLADTADGFGGGRTVAQKLEIMKDSRIGSYGVLALIFASAIKIACLGSLSGAQGLAALIAAHALARGALPFAAFALPYARSSGLAVSVGQPTIASLVIAGVLAIAVALIALPPITALACVGAVGAVTITMRLVARRQIGGYSGDVLGAIEQMGESAILLVVSVLV